MRKLGLIALLVLVLVTQALAINIPAPFGKVKQIALTEPKDEDGNYIKEISFLENGKEIIFVLAYIPSVKVIGIGSTIDWLIYEYWEETGKISVAYGPVRYSVKEENRGKFFEAAFKVMRSLVIRNLI